MNRNAMLTVAALLSNLLLTLHIADDILIGGPRGLTNLIAILVCLVFLVGTLLLNGRRSGYLIMFFGGLISAAMPVMHMWNGIGKLRGFFFIWGLLAIGTVGLFTTILAADGLRRTQRTSPQ